MPLISLIDTMRIMKATLFALLLSLIVGPIIVHGQQTPNPAVPPTVSVPGQQGRGSISKESILYILSLQGLTPEQKRANASILISAVQVSGVDFETTPMVEQELRDAGAAPEMIAAIRANYRPQAAASSTPLSAERLAEREKDPATTN
jgi:hypothetical protein